MKDLKKAFLPIVTFVRIDVKRLFRDKVAIFFVFIFPLIFLFVFGGIFGGDTNISFNVGLINQSDSEFSKQFIEQVKSTDIIKINEEVTDLDLANEKMQRGEIEATIILPPEFGQLANKKYPSGEAKVLYNQNNQQAGQTLGSVIEVMFKDMNKQFVAQETPFTVTTETTAEEGFSQFDYTFSGLLGFTILSLGIFGPTSVFPRLKQRGVLRRYQTTTLKVWQYFTGNVLSNAFVGILSAATMFAVALLFFNLNMKGDYLSMIILVVLGVIMLFGVGLAVGGWAKNENQAAPLANLISFPMMFLSGVFFPRFLMPEWLQSITQFIPLTPVVDGIRLIVTEGENILALGPQLAYILVWTVVIYAIALRVFRWE